MNIILINELLSIEEIEQIKFEFPQYEIFFRTSEIPNYAFDEKNWDRVEILLDTKLTVEELQKASQLKWVHSPSTYTHEICEKELTEQGGILLSNTRGFYISQISEFVIGSLFSFSKELFSFFKLQDNLKTLFESDKKEQVWGLTDRRVCLVGLGRVGTALASRLKQWHLHVTGVHYQLSFHPHCDQVLDFDSMDQALPNSDIVILTLSRLKKHRYTFTKYHLEKMKQDSILILLGVDDIIDHAALAEVAASGKFKAVLFDSSGQLPLENSPIANHPNILITPNIASYPRAQEKKLFGLFVHNLRQFTFDSISEMKNLLVTETEI